MFLSILYVLLAIFGLSFLVFIHELGHCLMARRLGIRVEVFSIGFGRPIYSWEKDNIKWQIGWLPFGGYVKIAGMEGNDQTEPHEITEGFYSKSPWDRIKVLLMGPIVNIAFALLAFLALWMMGGREKNFAEYTHKIGWVDPKSEIFAKGVRPGDEIISYNDQPYQSVKDNTYAPMTAHGNVEVKGAHINPYTNVRTPFSYIIKPYPHPESIVKTVLTTGILDPANYLIYDRLPNGQDNPFLEGSPMKESGIQYGDRIVWIDGEMVYSMKELSHLLNDSRAFLTVQRGNDIIFRRVPRIQVEELKLDLLFREELVDWQFEAGLKGTKVPKLYTVPYHLNNEGVVESPVKFIDSEKENDVFSQRPYSPLEAPLEKGDKIIAIDGRPVQKSYQIFADLQQHLINIVVERNSNKETRPSVDQADQKFDQHMKFSDLQALVSQIGLPSKHIKSSGQFYLLNPVVAKMKSQFVLSPEGQALADQQLEAQRKEIESIVDPEKRAQAFHRLEQRDRQIVLGLSIQDEKILYNPNPIELFDNVFEEIWHTLSALFTGAISPKFMSGPIGIVQVVHDSSMVSLKEALFWLGAISLNLGVLNLLPLPVLDGGNICFALYEIITGKRLKAKTMEKLVIPFAILLIGFFIYITFWDLDRIFKFFH